LPQRFFGSYSEARFWSVLEQFVPRKKGQLALEIGCAPGGNLHQLARQFDCVPHGVDFSGAGVDRTRQNFRDWGYVPENVICADAFDDGFQQSVSGKFDVVLSRGLIEHFTEMPPVIDAHLGPLRGGGLLIVTIPNYRWLNYAVGWLTIRDSYPLHNFAIMDSSRFSGLFESPQLETLRCEYLGGFDFGMFDDGAHTGVLWLWRRLQAALNLSFRVLPPPELRFTSPQLVYIGRKVSFSGATQ